MGKNIFADIVSGPENWKTFSFGDIVGTFVQFCCTVLEVFWGHVYIVLEVFGGHVYTVLEVFGGLLNTVLEVFWGLFL